MTVKKGLGLRSRTENIVTVEGLDDKGLETKRGSEYRTEGYERALSTGTRKDV